jgi:hypothetical protein
MRGDLGSFMALETTPLDRLEYLLTAGTRSVEIFLCVALDFWRSTASWLDLVAQLAQPVGELRLIDSRGELLAGEESTFLQGARRAVLAR